MSQSTVKKILINDILMECPRNRLSTKSYFFIIIDRPTSGEQMDNWNFGFQRPRPAHSTHGCLQMCRQRRGSAASDFSRHDARGGFFGGGHLPLHQGAAEDLPILHLPTIFSFVLGG